MPVNNLFQDLIHRVRQRDEAAATELVRKYENVIRRVIRMHLRRSPLQKVLDSVDVCQSVMASFFVRTAMGQYELETPEQLLSLLTTIARNKLTNQTIRLQAQRRDIKREAVAGDNVDQLQDHSPDPSEQVSNKEILEKVHSRLSQEEQYLVEQRSLGKSWKEISGELGGTDVALRKKLTRALNRVMAELGLDEESDD